MSGAASGIGLATVAALRAWGAEVLGTDCSPSPADASLIQADLTNPTQVDALFDAVQTHLGAPDILVSCAGLGLHEQLATGDPAKWARVLDVNALGALRFVRAFVPGMLQQGGDIVIISSVAAQQAYPWGGPYAASKAALDMAAETLRLEVLPSIRVTTIAPGAVDTPLLAHMLSGNQSADEAGLEVLQAEQVAELIVYAVSRPANMAISHLTVRPRAQAF